MKNAKTLKIISICIIVMGVVTILEGIITAFWGDPFNNFSDPSTASISPLAAVFFGGAVVIGGIVVLITGLLGIRSVNNPQKIGAFLTLAIIGTISSIVSVINAFFSGSMIPASIINALFCISAVIAGFNVKKEYQAMNTTR